MSLAQRLAWFEAMSTTAIIAAMLSLPGPTGQDGSTLLGVVARGALVVAVCSAAFYFNDLYDFDTPHSVVIEARKPAQDR